MANVLDGLNQQQQCAVTSPASVLQVLAPPGSGKTKTLTARVAYLIATQNLRPWNMIVCTFTIKAAREMKERIRSFVGAELESKLVLGTFHSVARRYLATYGQHIGIAKGFGIADSADSLAIIKRIVKRKDFQTEPAKARSRISRLKSGVATEKSTSKIDLEKQEFDAVYAEYEETLKSSNLLDYDDLLLRCVQLLREFPECVSNIEAVLIDEFQDTNCVQYDLMKLFAQHRTRKDAGTRIPSITIVGDPDQSIYSFRSAEIKNLKSMIREYPDTHVVILEENYRSSGAILQSALEVIEQDTARPAKKLLATHCVGERPILRTLPSAATEALWLVTEMNRIIVSSGGLLKYIDFAVLLRSAALSRHIESALGKAGIPYRMIGGHRFFDRVEVKILLDYLRVISQPDHNDAFVRIINTPSRKIGDVTIKALLEEAETQKRTLWSLVLDIAQGRKRSSCKLSSQAEKGLEVVVNIILTSQKKLHSEDNTPCTIFDLIGHVMKRLSFEEYLRRSHPEDFDARWENVQQLIMLASDVSSRDQAAAEDLLHEIDDVEQQVIDGTAETLEWFLANVALSTDTQTMKADEEAPDVVTISTIHAAKGLEWPIVFIPAAYQGSIPHSRSEDTDEERRLLYVGMTRAQGLLYVSWPMKSSAGESTTLSPFLSTKPMSRYFEKHGPPANFSVFQDMARILRRDCPAEIAISKSRSMLERTEDDQWLESEVQEEEVIIYNYNYDSGSVNNDFDGFNHRPFKKPRLVQTTSDPQYGASSYNNKSNTMSGSTAGFNTGFISASACLQQMQTADLNKPEKTTRHFAKTINRSVSASAGSGGFMSAGNRLKQLEAETTVKAVTQATVVKTVEAVGKENKKVVPAKGTKRQIQGQGSLLNFFSKK